MLKNKQKKALEMMLSGSFSQKDIAETIGVSEQTITNWKKNDEFIKEFNDSLKNSINTAAGKAFKRIMELLEKADADSVSLNAAKDILDRAGFKADSLLKVDGSFSVGRIDEILEQLEDNSNE